MTAKTTAPDTTALTAAVASLAILWNEEDATREIVPNLTCLEVGAIVAVFTAAGHHEVAEGWANVHLEEDGPCDCKGDDDADDEA